MKNQPRKKPDSATRLAANVFGVFSYVFGFVAYFIVLCVAAAGMLVGAGVHEPPTSQPAASSTLASAVVSPLAVAQTAFVVVVTAAVLGTIVWVMVRVPPAVIRYMSGFVLATARHIPLPSSPLRFLYTKIVLSLAPAVIMAGVFITWRSSTAGPLFVATVCFSLIAVGCALCQYASARVGGIKEAELL